jgi:hypothetical protein
MNSHKLLEILKNPQVQHLIRTAVSLYKDYPQDVLQLNIIDILKDELSQKKEGPSSNWIQAEFPL